MKKVCVLYGGAEGQLNGKKLTNELEKAGFSLTKDPYNADVLICHSAGIFQVPIDCDLPLVLAIGTPRTKSLNIASHVGKKLYLEFRHPNKVRSRIKKLGINLVYILNIRNVSKTYVNYKKQNYDCVKENRVVLVANKQDPFTDFSSCLSISGAENWNFIGFPGQHDDLWISPKPYIDILKSCLK